MILVSVGTQLGFDRLVRAVDEWLLTQEAQEAVFQIGHGEYRPRHGRWSRFMGFGEYHDLAQEADLLVSHAGMGALLTAMQTERPLLVMPRRGHLGEHRNDHQQDAANHIFPQFGVPSVPNSEELHARLDHWHLIEAPARSESEVSPPLAPNLAQLVSELT